MSLRGSRVDNLRRYSVPIGSLVVLFTLVSGGDAGELADRVGARLQKALEQQFGALEPGDVYEKKQIFGTVIGLNYSLKGGKLEDGWTAKAAAGLQQIGIEAKASKSEVRAKDQMIEGKKFSSLQITSSRGVEEKDSLGVSLLLTP